MWIDANAPILLIVNVLMNSVVFTMLMFLMKLRV